MILSTTKNIEWTSMDAKRLADILQSDFGQKLIQNWLNNTPALLDGSDVNKTLVANGRVAGYSQAIQDFIGLTNEQPAPVEPERDTHPSLDSDAGWPDELKLAKPTTPSK